MIVLTTVDRWLTGGPAMVRQKFGGGKRWSATVDRRWPSLTGGSERGWEYEAIIRIIWKHTWHAVIGGSGIIQLLDPEPMIGGEGNCLEASYTRSYWMIT
ncbi:hypothetical protein Tco_1149731 [Tanacetum coccineum]